MSRMLVDSYKHVDGWLLHVLQTVSYKWFHKGRDTRLIGRLGGHFSPPCLTIRRKVFPIKGIQFKEFCPSVNTSSPPAESINRIPVPWKPDYSPKDICCRRSWLHILQGFFLVLVYLGHELLFSIAGDIHVELIKSIDWSWKHVRKKKIWNCYL